jgi:hypothetical protein
MTTSASNLQSLKQRGTITRSDLGSSCLSDVPQNAIRPIVAKLDSFLNVRGLSGRVSRKQQSKISLTDHYVPMNVDLNSSRPHLSHKSSLTALPPMVFRHARHGSLSLALPGNGFTPGR